jgi:hypothetical protein
MASPTGKQEDILKGLKPGEDEDIIELTEVVTEGEAETLIELPPELKVLDSLDFKTLLGEEPESPQPEPTLPEPQLEPEPEGDVDGALAALLGPLEEEPQQPTSFPEIEAQEPPPPLADTVASMTAEQLVENVMARFGETRLTEIIEPIIRDIAEKICRELFPGIAEEIISKEIEALKNSVE